MADAKEKKTTEEKDSTKSNSKLGKYFYAVGRRKTASATVRVFPGKGDSTINDKPAKEVYSGKIEQGLLFQPFKAADLDIKEYHITAKVKGSGTSSQLDAIRLGISRALVVMNPELKKPLKAAGLMTRDPRMVERKKPGLHKARKAEQYSKR